MHTIVLNRQDLQGTDNNRLVYDIPGARAMEGAEIALAQLSMYYSWQNINDQPLFNNTLSITIPPLAQDGNGNPIAITTATTVQITIPNGVYQVADVQAYFEQWAIDNNFYLINSSTGEYVYFFQMQVNPTRYALQFNSFALPYPSGGSLPAGYSQPPDGFLSGLNGVTYANGAFPATGNNFAPGWVFPGQFYEWAGFTQATSQPGGANNYFTTTDAFPNGSSSFLSDTSPDVQPNSVIYLNCNVIQNSYSNPQTFMYPISATADIGDLITIDVNQFAWNKVTPGVASQIIMTLTDKLGRPIIIQDPNIVITLVIRDHHDKVSNMGASSTGNQPSSMESQRYMRNPSNHATDTPHASHMRMLHKRTMA